MTKKSYLWMILIVFLLCLCAITVIIIKLDDRNVNKQYSEIIDKSNNLDSYTISNSNINENIINTLSDLSFELQNIYPEIFYSKNDGNIRISLISSPYVYYIYCYYNEYNSCFELKDEEGNLLSSIKNSGNVCDNIRDCISYDIYNYISNNNLFHEYNESDLASE